MKNEMKNQNRGQERNQSHEGQSQNRGDQRHNEGQAKSPEQNPSTKQDNMDQTSELMCNECGVSFATSSELNNHNKSEHPEMAQEGQEASARA